MRIANVIRRLWRRSFTWCVPATMAWSVVLLATSTPASAQRPLIFEHAGELVRYLDGLRIAEPVVVDRIAV